MGSCCACCIHEPETPSPPIPKGITRICVAGGKTCEHVARARRIASYICKNYPEKYESWLYFTSPGICGDGYYKYIEAKTKHVPFPDHLKGFSTMPLCWFENGPEKKWTVLGGRQQLAEWAIKEFPNDKKLVELASTVQYSQAFHGGCCCSGCFCCGGFDPEDDRDREFFSTCLLTKPAEKNSPTSGYDSVKQKQ